VLGSKQDEQAVPDHLGRCLQDDREAEAVAVVDERGFFDLPLERRTHRGSSRASQWSQRATSGRDWIANSASKSSAANGRSRSLSLASGNWLKSEGLSVEKLESSYERVDRLYWDEYRWRVRAFLIRSSGVREALLVARGSVIGMDEAA
jgi:hypothetical protein